MMALGSNLTSDVDVALAELVNEAPTCSKATAHAEFGRVQRAGELVRISLNCLVTPILLIRAPTPILLIRAPTIFYLNRLLPYSTY